VHRFSGWLSLWILYGKIGGGWFLLLLGSEKAGKKDQGDCPESEVGKKALGKKMGLGRH